MKKGRKFLALVLTVLMVVSVLPITVLAEEETATWTKLDSIADAVGLDAVAITMTKGDATWALPSATATESNPSAVAATVAGTTLTTTGASGDFAWKITATDGGYHIRNANGSYLAHAGSKNGSRVDSTVCVWSVRADGTHLTVNDGTDQRSLGVYESKDWRAYRDSNGSVQSNISGQQVSFWKLTGESGGTDPTPDPEPTETYKPVDGDKVVLYNPGNGVVLTDTASGSKLAGQSATVADGKLTAEKAVELIVSVSGEEYTFKTADGRYLTSGATGSSLTFSAEDSDYAKWTLETQDTGWYIKNKSAAYTDGSSQYMEYYGGFTTYGLKSGGAAYLMQFFKSYTIGGTPDPEPEPEPEPSGSSWVKVTGEPENGDWSGTYLIVYEDGTTAQVLDGSKGVDGIDAALNYVGLEITDGTITHDASIAVTLTKLDNGGYTLKTAGGAYLIRTASTNGMDETADEATATSSPLTITWSDGVTIASSGGPTLQFYKSGNNSRFRFYKSAQQAITLYKLDESASGDGHVVINQAYGGGGNSGALFARDFIELYNPTSKDIDLTGWSVQYAAKAGTFSTNITELTGTIKAHGYYLIWEAEGSNKELAALPDADAEGKIAMSGTEFKLALVNNAEAITGQTDENVVDFLGVGGANEYETAPTSKISNSTAACRVPDGKDTDDNSADFQIIAPNPRNSKSESGDTPAPGGTYAIYERVETPVAGETYLIVNPTAGNALTSKAGDRTYQFLGAEVTVVDGNAYIKTADEAVSRFTVSINDDGTYTFTQGTNVVSAYLNGTNANLSMDPSGHVSAWELSQHTAANNSFVLTAKDLTGSYGPIRLEWYANYSVFTAYSANSTTNSVYEFAFYKETGKTADKLPGGGEEPDEPADPGYLPQDGDDIVIFNPSSGLVLATSSTGSLKGAAASASGGKLFTDGTHLVLHVSVTGTGDSAVYTFTTDDGKVLATKTTGQSLTLEDAGTTQATTWKLAKVDGGYTITSVDANYNGKPQAIEVYNGNYTTYGYTEGNAIFTMRFYTVAMLGKDLETNTDLEDTIAQWGGGGPYSEAQSQKVQGDLFNTGDMLDKSASFTVKADGVDAQPYQRTTGSGGGNYNYYMGGEKIGAKTGDYMQFALSTKGYGDMTLSFRMRVTGAGAKEYTLQYSTDGMTFSNFENGKYSYAYHNYATGNDESGSGTCVNGVASIPKDSQYISFTFDVPVGAENAETLYIRFVPGTTKINGSAGAIGGNVRIDSVKLVGSPIEDETLPGYVTAEPDGQDEDVPAGTTVTLTASNSGVTVMYRFLKPDGSDLNKAWSTGTTAVLPTDLPAALEIKAVKDGVEGPVRRLIYQAGTVESVKMKPNGGGIVFNGSVTTYSITLSCATEGADIWYRTSTMNTDADNDGKVDFVKYEQPIVVDKGFKSLTVEAYATKDGLANSSVVSRTFTERAKEKYDLYFGQMHSHTSVSDGSGTPAEAYAHADNLEDVWNMDFLFVTDHSNSIDGAGGSKTINDEPDEGEWQTSKEAALKATNSSFVGLYGYEMTWSNGLGHINTFNTVGFQDRTQTAYTAFSTALQNYYAELKTAPASISQFNHPGTTFGDFSDFAHYDPEIDELITLIEVGNGEGAIGSSGYFPSYEYYTRALDKGWHVAPTNNQDNHKGHWGDANTGRDVVLVDELTEEAIYDAMRNYRVYATEDLNLEIYYTFDGQIMGTQLTKDDVGDTAVIRVELNDPDSSDHGSARVEVIVNGGLVVESTTSTLDHDIVELKVPTTYNYYYIKVTQADGNIAVTAPVWVGAVEAVGVSGFTAQDALTVAGVEQTFNLSLYNNEKKNFEVTGITVIDKSTGETVATISGIDKVKKMGTAEATFTYAFKTDGIYTLTATVKGTLDGVEKAYTQDLEVTVMPAKLVTKILVDGTHYNDYVTGYYGGNMGNMTTIAANNAVQVTVVKDQITSEMLKDCSLLVLSAPAKKGGTANAGDYTASLYSDEFIAMVKEYVQNGGSVIVTGLADYQDKNAEGDNYHSAAQQNKLLGEIGSTMTINDDEVCDDTHNGGQNYRLYPEIFNTEDPTAATWLKGLVTAAKVEEGENYQTYSQYSGCSIDIGSGTWLVKGWDDTTYSIDSDDDNLGGIAKGSGKPVYFLGYEKVGQGNVFVAGGVFVSDFEVKAELDNIWDLPYANRTIYENILSELCLTDEVTDIAETRKAELNKLFVIEGYVTSGTEYPGTTFFDAIYVQDKTGGTTCFPYADSGLKIGTKVRILGYTDAYQDDREMQIISLKVLDDEPYIYEALPLTTLDAHNYETYGGQYVQTTGTVSDIVWAGEKVSQFKLTDYTGVATTIFIDGYIWNKDNQDNVSAGLEEGMVVTAAGLSYMHPEGEGASVCVLRVRDMDDIKLNTTLPESDVFTGKVTEAGKTATVTTAKPAATVLNGKASSAITSEMGTEIVRQAAANNSAAVVIAPEITGDVTSAEVLIPGDVLSDIGTGTGAALVVRTPVGDVTVPNKALAALGASGDVTVSVGKNSDGTYTVGISANGEAVKAVPGGIKAALPMDTGNVAVLVEASGERLIFKSLVEDGKTYVILNGTGTVKLIDNSKTFVDVPVCWFDSDVYFASSHELLVGTEVDTFSPGMPTSRAMMAAVLWRLEGSPAANAASGFPDVPADTYYTEAVAWAKENRIIYGFDNGTFGPHDSLTREQMVAILYRYAEYLGMDVTARANLDGFADSGLVGPYAKDAMEWAVANGIIAGMDEYTLDPSGTATRAQVAAVLQRFVRLLVK